MRRFGVVRATGNGNPRVAPQGSSTGASTTAAHTFASWPIAGDVQLSYLARLMGKSVQMIDQTYGHLLPDSEEYLRGLLDNYDG